MPHLDLLRGVVDVPGELGQAALGLGQEVQLGQVHLVGRQAAQLTLLLRHKEIPLNQMLRFTVFQIFNFL